MHFSGTYRLVVNKFGKNPVRVGLERDDITEVGGSTVALSSYYDRMVTHRYQVVCPSRLETLSGTVQAFSSLHTQ